MEAAKKKLEFNCLYRLPTVEKKGNERQNRNKSQTKRVNKRLKPVLNLEFAVKFNNSFSFVLHKTSAFFLCYDKRKVIEIKRKEF